MLYLKLYFICKKFYAKIMFDLEIARIQYGADYRFTRCVCCSWVKNHNYIVQLIKLCIPGVIPRYSHMMHIYRCKAIMMHSFIIIKDLILDKPLDILYYF